MPSTCGNDSSTSAGSQMPVSYSWPTGSPNHANGSPTAPTPPAEWMALKSGTTVGRTRTELGTSGRLNELPLTAGELRTGNLTTEQADTITDAAALNPAAEQDLIDQPQRDSLKNLRDEAERRKAQAETDANTKQQRIHKERSARFWVKNGTWHLHANGPIDTGAELQQAVERIINTHYQHPTPADQREPARRVRLRRTHQPRPPRHQQHQPNPNRN